MYFVFGLEPYVFIVFIAALAAHSLNPLSRICEPALLAQRGAALLGVAGRSTPLERGGRDYGVGSTGGKDFSPV